MSLIGYLSDITIGYHDIRSYGAQSSGFTQSHQLKMVKRSLIGSVETIETDYSAMTSLILHKLTSNIQYMHVYLTSMLNWTLGTH